MIIKVDDCTYSAKLLFYQSLVLLFLPCESFTDKDTDRSLYVSASQSDGICRCHIELRIGEKFESADGFEDVCSETASQMKNLIGRTIIEAFRKLCGRKPPWGISTGVKPVKLARPIVEAFGESRAMEILTQSYLFDKRKAKLCIDACRTENRIMQSMGKRPCSVYISIPFCPTKCNYCSFVSCTTPRLLSLIPDYLIKLYSEIYAISDVVNSCSLNIKSIYVGGGTPAILDEFQIDGLMSVLASRFDVANVEFTFEAGRPDCITKEKLRVLRDYGVGRVSINTQSTNDDVLKSIGRNHTYAQYIDVMETARMVGFDCINTDLIAGLPGESVQSFCKSLDDVLAMSPENITVHSFTLKKSSLYRIGGNIDVSRRDDDACLMTDYAADKLGEKCYDAYYIYRQKNTVGNLENTGYSKPGHESIYNMVTMGEYHTVLAAGAGAVTKLVSSDAKRVERLFSPKYPYEFLDGKKYRGFDKDAVCGFYDMNNY